MATKQLLISASVEITDILMAELGEIGFDIFEDLDSGIAAYCPADVYDAGQAHEIIDRYLFLGPIDVVYNDIEKENWNAVWETNYDPIRISNQVLIRASFHEPDESFPLEIIINPKMSFGTGHHQTTALMVEALLEINLTNKTVLDAGTGTGILAFVAWKRGALRVHGFDIDSWAVENSMENAGLNDCTSVTFSLGNIRDEDATVYDVLIANINRNILLDEMEEYAKRISSGGYLFLSGFYTSDISLLAEAAKLHGLTVQVQSEKEQWACLRLLKA
jgi:ribosomal protein L11 methyltransferase